jgi:hypothetical protein
MTTKQLYANQLEHALILMLGFADEDTLAETKAKVSALLNDPIRFAELNRLLANTGIEAVLHTEPDLIDGTFGITLRKLQTQDAN